MESYPILYAPQPVQGSEHIRKENEARNLSANRKFPCQDRSCAEEITAMDGTKFKFLCISDGHGAPRYFRSDKGAEFAISGVKSFLQDNMGEIRTLVSENQYEKIETEIKTKIPIFWRKKIEDDLKEFPITNEEYLFLEMAKEDEDIKISPRALNNLEQAIQNYKKGVNLHKIYGCTLIVWFAVSVQESNFWIAFQCGDGEFGISYDGKKFQMPITDDPDYNPDRPNITSSLCSENVETKFRFFHGNEIPKAVFCCSDGISKNFSSSDECCNRCFAGLVKMLNQGEFSKCLSDCPKMILEKDADAKCDLNCRYGLYKKDIEEYLPEYSRYGGDDVSIAFYINPNEMEIQGVFSYLFGKKMHSDGDTEHGLQYLKCSADNYGNHKACEILGNIYLNDAEKIAQDENVKHYLNLNKLAEEYRRRSGK